VYDLYRDPQGGIWTAHSQGLSRLETGHSLSSFGAEEGLSGNVMETLRVGGTLYTATLKGVFALRASEEKGQPARFDRLTIPGRAHDLLPFGESVLAATTAGVYRIVGTSVERLNVLKEDEGAIVLAPSHRDSSRFFVGTLNGPGLVSVRRTDTGWDREGSISVPPLSRLATGPEGALWGGTKSASLYRVAPHPDDWQDRQAAVARYDTSHGLPSLYANLPYRVKNRLVVGTVDGPYRFEPSSERFVTDASLRAPLPDPSQYAEAIVADTTGDVWMQVGSTGRPVTGRLAANADAGYTWQPGALRRLTGFTAFDIYPEDDATWIGGPGLGPEALLVRRGATPPHQPPVGERRSANGKRSARGPAALIRRMRLPAADSVLVFGGGDSVQLDHDYAAVRFSYAAPAFDAPEETTYRTRLEGYDDTWSGWRSSGEATYTNLEPGRYTFRVQARDVYHRTGPAATQAFIVRPPWYRTGWAYALWGLLGLAVLAGGVRARTWHRRRRQRRLEATVAHRTDEVRRQRDRLEEQAAQLRELDEAKSRFFANISHEFRTPLTLILGPVRRLKDRLRHPDTPLKAGLETELEPEDAAEELSVVERNAYRLLRMVRQLLDLARRDAGTLQVQARPVDVGPRAERITRAFEPLAERQDLTLTVQVEPPVPEAAPVYLDPERFEQILGNLLSNALKFTPPGGRITVRVAETTETVQVTVRDTGPGIPDAEQDRIFERFAQGDETATRSQEGAGIGLALTQSLVTVHGGRLAVESVPEKGTAFTATFRRGRAHLADEQVVEAPPDTVAPNEPAPLDDSLPLDDSPASSRREDSGAVLPRQDRVPTSPRTDRGGETMPEGRTGEESAAPFAEDTPLVLIVDDNADVRAYVRSVLAPDFRVAEAATGAEGLEQARNRLPDVILADVMMPEMDGLTMTENLRKDPATEAIPVVMLTARAGADDEVEGLSVGATDYVVKPFDPQVLEMRVRGTLAYQARLRRHLLSELRTDGRDGEPAGGKAASSSGDLESRDPNSRDAGKEDSKMEDSRQEDPGQQDSRSGGSKVAGGDPEEPAFEDRVLAAVARRLPDPDLDPQMLAEALAVSRATLYRRLKETALPSPAQLIREMRLDRGASLLEEGAGSVSQVAYAVGFESLSHFSRCFAERYDRPPSEYRG